MAIRQTPMEKLAARTRKANALRREARAKDIYSPYKQGVYIKKNLNRKTTND